MIRKCVQILRSFYRHIIGRCYCEKPRNLWVTFSIIRFLVAVRTERRQEGKTHFSDPPNDEKTTIKQHFSLIFLHPKDLKTDFRRYSYCFCENLSKGGVSRDVLLVAVARPSTLGFQTFERCVSFRCKRNISTTKRTRRVFPFSLARSSQSKTEIFNKKTRRERCHFTLVHNETKQRVFLFRA